MSKSLRNGLIICAFGVMLTFLIGYMADISTRLGTLEQGQAVIKNDIAAIKHTLQIKQTVVRR